MLWINDYLSTFDFDYELFKLKFLNSNSEPKMYLSFYILNTFFIILSAMMLVFISESKQFIATNSEKILLISVAIFSIAFSQFVIVPYDVSITFADRGLERHPDDLIRLPLHRCDFLRDGAKSPAKQSMALFIGCSVE